MPVGPVLYSVYTHCVTVCRGSASTATAANCSKSARDSLPRRDCLPSEVDVTFHLPAYAGPDSVSLL